MENFLYINEDGKLEYKGEVFKINAEFQYLSNNKKIEMLILLINWANDEIDKINKSN